MSSLPLSGVRVVELTTTWAGPMCGCLLGDLGADVVKVEHPSGEVARRSPPFLPDTQPPVSFMQATVNRNKRSLTLDLHEPRGALGYVDAAAEIVRQADRLRMAPTAIVLASGSATTHAGVLVGLRSLGRDDIAVYGICVRRDAEAQRARVTRVVRKTEELLECVGVVEEDAVLVTDEFLGPAYGRPSSRPGLNTRSRR